MIHEVRVRRTNLPGHGRDVPPDRRVIARRGG